MNCNRTWALGIFGFFISALLLVGCSGSKAIIIDAPDDNAVQLAAGAGDNYKYYAPKDLAPEDWGDVSKGVLYICDGDEQPKRAPLIPDEIAANFSNSSFHPGDFIIIKWSGLSGVPNSSGYGINKMYATYGVTYEECIDAALKEIFEANVPSLILTDYEGQFASDYRVYRMVNVVFE